MRKLLGLTLALAACGGAAAPGAPEPSVPEAVRTAPERVDVDGRSYTLRVDLYRDVMPRVGPSPTPRGVSGTIFLRADVEGDAPDGLRAEKAWLINGAQFWETVPQPLQTLTVDRRHHLSLGIGAGKREGPVWDVGSQVDVVLQFTAVGRTYLIQQRGVAVVGAY